MSLVCNSVVQKGRQLVVLKVEMRVEPTVDLTEPMLVDQKAALKVDRLGWRLEMMLAVHLVAPLAGQMEH